MRKRARSRASSWRFTWSTGPTFEGECEARPLEDM